MYFSFLLLEIIECKLLGRTPLILSCMQFAVLYEARANTGIERMAIINAVAKSVPQPHMVDLSNPDKTIIVQIVKVNRTISSELAVQNNPPQLSIFNLFCILYYLTELVL